MIGRTPDSLAMKLSNFASLDPVQQLRGIRGLAGASQQDRSIWKEFHLDLTEMAAQSEEALFQAFGVGPEDALEVLPQSGIRLHCRPTHGGQDVVSTTTQRRGQNYFREAVLNNFGGCCGITQISVRELLIASHILPWSAHPESRLDVRNGLCLSRLHDAAFDNGLIAFDDNLRLLLSPKLKLHFSNPSIDSNFGLYEGRMLKIPAEGVPPDLEYLALHRQRVGIYSR